MSSQIETRNIILRWKEMYTSRRTSILSLGSMDSFKARTYWQSDFSCATFLQMKLMNRRLKNRPSLPAVLDDKKSKGGTESMPTKWEGQRPVGKLIDKGRERIHGGGIATTWSVHHFLSSFLNPTYTFSYWRLLLQRTLDLHTNAPHVFIHPLGHGCIICRPLLLEWGRRLGRCVCKPCWPLINEQCFSPLCCCSRQRGFLVS